MRLRPASLGTVLFGFSLFANATVINFDDLGVRDSVDDTYAADGVFFQTSDWFTQIAIGQTSQPYVSYSFRHPQYRYAAALSGAVGIFCTPLHGAFTRLLIAPTNFRLHPHTTLSTIAPLQIGRVFSCPDLIMDGVAQ